MPRYSANLVSNSSNRRQILSCRATKNLLLAYATLRTTS